MPWLQRIVALGEPEGTNSSPASAGRRAHDQIGPIGVRPVIVERSPLGSPSLCAPSGAAGRRVHVCPAAGLSTYRPPSRGPFDRSETAVRTNCSLKVTRTCPAPTRGPGVRQVGLLCDRGEGQNCNRRRGDRRLDRDLGVHGREAASRAVKCSERLEEGVVRKVRRDATRAVIRTPAALGRREPKPSLPRRGADRPERPRDARPLPLRPSRPAAGGIAAETPWSIRGSVDPLLQGPWPRRGPRRACRPGGAPARDARATPAARSSSSSPARSTASASSLRRRVLSIRQSWSRASPLNGSMVTTRCRSSTAPDMSPRAPRRVARAKITVGSSGRTEIASRTTASASSTCPRDPSAWTRNPTLRPWPGNSARTRRTASSAI